MSSNWTDVAAAGEVWEGTGISVSAGDREVALFRADGEVFATDVMCTHGAARLCDGYVEGQEVECPIHQARFDLRTGAPRCGPATDAIRIYPVRVVDGRIEVALGA